jgi:hypothetical protein
LTERARGSTNVATPMGADSKVVASSGDSRPDGGEGHWIEIGSLEGKHNGVLWGGLGCHGLGTGVTCSSNLGKRAGGVGSRRPEVAR